MSSLESAQGRENSLILGAQNLIALGIDPRDSGAQQKILKELSRTYRAEKKQGNTNLSMEGWVNQRLNTISDGLAGGAGLEPPLEGGFSVKTQDEIDYDAANGLFQQDQLAEDSYTAEDRDSVGKTRKANPNNVAGFFVRDGQSVEAKAQSLEKAAQYSDDPEFIERVSRFREDAKLQSYGLKAADDGSTYDTGRWKEKYQTSEPTLVDIQNTVVGNPRLNQELQGKGQRLRDATAAEPTIAQDRLLGQPAARADNALSAYLESRLLRNQQAQDDSFVNTIRKIRGLGAEQPRTPMEDLGNRGVLDTNYQPTWPVTRSAVPGLPGESTWVDSVSGQPAKTTANTPDSAQVLNAPQPSRADQALYDFISPRLFEPSMDRAGRPTRYREVNISQITNDLYRRLGKTPVKGAPLIDSFQEEMREAARQSEVLYDDPIRLDNGETYRPAVGGDTGRPKSINAVLNSLGYEPYEKDQLANALYQELTATRSGNASTKVPIAFGDNNNIQYGRPSIDFRQTEGRTIYRDESGEVRRIPGDDLKAAQERIIGAIPGNYTRPSTGKTVFRQEPYETRRVYLNKATGKGYTPREAMNRALETGRDQATARRIGTDNASLRRDQKRTDESTALRRMLGQGTILAPSRNPNITGNPRTTRPNSFWPGLGASGGAAPARNAEDTQFFNRASSSALIKGEMAERSALRKLITEGTSSSAPAETFVSYRGTPDGNAAKVERGVGPLVRGTKLEVPAFNDSRFAPTSARDTTGDTSYIRSRESRPVGTVAGDPTATPMVPGDAVGAINSEKSARIKRNRQKDQARVTQMISDVLESTIDEKSYEMEQVPSDVLNLAQRAGEGTLTDNDISAFRQWSQTEFANDPTNLGEIEDELSNWPTTAVTQKNAQEAQGFRPVATSGAEPPANTTPLPSAVRPVQNGGTAAIPDTSDQQARVPARPNPGSGPIENPFSKERRNRNLRAAAGLAAGVGLGSFALNQTQG